jgi:hypothetical protein
VSDIVTFRTKQRTIDCDAGDDLAAAVRQAKVGDTLSVREACDIEVGGDDP